MNLASLNNSWINSYKKPMLIAGPCSAESESQMLEIAARLSRTEAEVSAFRAGIWKPRTKPNGFEGVGSIGLKWLKKVKEEFGFQTATEVATAQHVQLALEHEVDILWIGARSTANPFTVQEIADALGKTEKTVLVKNPVNPDLELWFGALERLLGAGVTSLGAIHRGFSTYRKTAYRNEPNWQIALDFKNQYPNIPLIVDPSHICGNRTGLAKVAQEALNLGYEGVMLETHSSPDEAWSDAKQQITPEKFAEIVRNLILPSENSAAYEDDLKKYRMLLTDLDAQLIEIIGQRMKLSEEIGLLKKQANSAVFQPDRWKETMMEVEKRAGANRISAEFAIKLFKTIHEQSVAIQNEVFNSDLRSSEEK